MPEGAVRSISEDENGHIILGIDGGGIAIIDDNYLITKQLLYNEDERGALNDNGVYDVFIDKQNRFWVATYGGGVNIYDPNRSAFRHIDHEINNYNSLNNNFVRAFLEDKKGNWWFGTEKGVSRWNRQNNRWTHYYNERGKTNILGHNAVLSLAEDADGNIWIGTYSGGVTRLNPTTNQTTIFRNNTRNPNTLGTDFIYCIFRDSKDELWFGGIRGKVSKYDKATNAFKRYDIQAVFDMTETSNGDMYFGTPNGLIKLRRKDLKTSIIPLPNVVGNNLILCFHKTENDKIWLGTQSSGLIYYDTKTEKTEQYLTTNGLPSNIIVGILEDKNKRIWVSTGRGISCLDNGIFYNYDNQDGLENLEYNTRSFGKTSTNEFIFGGQNGFTIFKPLDFKNEKSKIPKIYFSDFKIANKSVAPSDVNAIISKPINDVKKLNLNYQQNAFTFDFVAIDYGFSAKNKYQWRLKGLEKEWSPVTTSHTAVYTNINPGHYVFEVKNSIDGKNWSAVRSIQIYIKPPFWRSIWAYLFYILVGVGVCFFIYNYLKIKIKEKSSEDKIQFFINIAHDLRTPLTLIKAPLQDLKEDKSLSENAQNKLNLIGKNSERLHQLMTQLLDFQKVDLGKMELQTREKDFIHYIKEKVTLFKSLAAEKSIQFVLNTDLDRLPLYYDTDKMDKIVYNLLSNAIKYTPKNGKVEVFVANEKGHCVLTIQDTGIGIPKDQQAHIFKRYVRGNNAVNHQIPGSGVGLMLTYQLVQLQKGKIELESEMDKGTTFIVRFPLGKQHLLPHQIITTNIPEVKDFPIVSLSNEINETPSISTANTPALSVLIVEDNPDLRNYISESLTGEYQVFTAENGAEGLEIAKAESPSLIISDVMMPIMNGMELCKNLKSNLETSHIPVILLTALNNTNYKVEGIQLGADVYLEKPFEIKVLKAYIQNLIAIRQRLQGKLQAKTIEVQKEDFPNPLDHEFIEKIRTIVLENLEDEDFSVEILCKTLLMSRPVLYRKVKALTGESIQNFTNVIRLNKAMELLKTQTYTISDVAYMTGFANPKYFSTSFKKHFGVSPSKIEP